MRSLLFLAATLITASATVTLAQTPEVAPPSNLWAAQTSAKEITLVWRPAPGAAGYVVYRDGGHASPGGRGASSDKIATLAANVSRYVFIVRGAVQEPIQLSLESMDASRRASPRVAFNTVTLVSGAVPAVAPGSVTATESAPGVISVRWTASPGATAYVLGRAVGGSGLKSLCAICSTETTFVDSGVTTGVRHVYSVAAITPSSVSGRTMSNDVTPGTVASGGGGGGGTGGIPNDSTHATTDTTAPAPAPPTDPMRGRYRVSLTGFTVRAQSYDHPLQIDGKGDEIYLATQVMAFDTASAGLVIDNRVLTSRVYGDVNRFSYRVRAGNAGPTGGLRTGDSYPASTSGKGASAEPTVLWQGELVQGRSAVVVVPTVWEWDDNMELFGNWITGRHALLYNLLQRDPMVAILSNGDPQPMELGSAGLVMHTNMFGDARDRPIGMRAGMPSNRAGFFEPLPANAKGAASANAAYRDKKSAVVATILPANPFKDDAVNGLQRMLGSVNDFAMSLGASNAQIPLPSILNAIAVLGPIGNGLRPVLGEAMRSQVGTGIRQIATVLAFARPSSFSTNLYFFEKMLVLTPKSVEAAFTNSKGAAGAALIDVEYVDPTQLQGRYVLHLKLEKLP